jgi:hypothetical protein
VKEDWEENYMRVNRAPSPILVNRIGERDMSKSMKNKWTLFIFIFYLFIYYMYNCSVAIILNQGMKGSSISPWGFWMLTGI